MRSVSFAATALVAALGFALVACEEPPAPQPTKPAEKPAAVTTAATAKPEAKPLSDEEKLAKVKECMTAMDADPEKFSSSCFAENVTHEAVDSVPPAKMTGRADVAAHFKQMRAAFSDSKHEVGPVFINGDQIAFLMVVHGKNTGEMHGMPATNKEVGFPVAVVGKMGPDGLWTEAKAYQDQSTMMGQLGMMPKEAPPTRAKIEKGAWFTETTYVVAKNDQTEKDNMAVYEKSGEAFNAHKVDDVLALYTDDAMFRYVPGAEDNKGKDAFKKAINEYYKFSSDVKSKVDWKFAAGDYVVAGITMGGTNDGAMPPMLAKPTGKTFETRGLEIVKLEGGKIKEHWIYENSLKSAVQLGLAPDPSTMAKGAGSAAPVTTPAKAPEKK